MAIAIELVHNVEDGTWWVRKRAENGELIWHTEQYQSRQHAEEVAEEESHGGGFEYVEESE